MMTKKDYTRAAEIVNLHVANMTPDAYVRTHLCAAFVQFFRGDNPRFDADRFRAACGVE